MIPIEILITLLIVFLQLRSFLRTKKKINNLRNLFAPYLQQNDIHTYKIISEDSIDLLALNIEAKSTNPQFRKILDSTNKYLKGNKGSAADFNILQDISERVSDAEESVISNTVSIPLYIGLMGTFVGVIVGLIGLLDFSLILGNGSSSENFASSDINNFLGGVFIAMVGSFCGLLFTTINNNLRFKDAKNERDIRKNDYYNFLQAELLPILNRDLSSSLSNLGSNLSMFNEQFSEKLMENLETFNSSFSENIASFNNNTTLVTSNLEKQNEFLEKIQEIGVNTIVEANLEIFKKFDENKEKFNNLFKFVESLDKSLTHSEKVADKILALFDRVTAFENNIKTLSNNFTQNETLIQNFINDVLGRGEELKKRYEALIQHINKVDDENQITVVGEREAILRLTTLAVRSLTDLSVNLQKTISELDNTIKNKLTRSFDFSEEKAKFAALIDDMKKEFQTLVNSATKETVGILKNYDQVILKVAKTSKEILDLSYDARIEHQASQALLKENNIRHSRPAISPKTGVPSLHQEQPVGREVGLPPFTHYINDKFSSLFVKLINNTMKKRK